MQTDHRSLNRLFAAFAFIIPLFLYWLTLAPTASFWDCSERIACAYGLQIPHPPGTPFYLLLGRVFSMFVATDWVAYSINFMSALASATTIMLLYLIVVRLVREFRGHPDQYPTIDKIGMYGGALIGALTFAVTDSHWFTSIEAETYALSLTFTALVVWLVLKWSENHNRPRNERWLILIVYIFGLAFGVHLLSLLAIFFVGLIIYFRKFEFDPKTFTIAGATIVGIFFLIFPITIIQLPTMAGAFEQATGGAFGPVTFGILIVGLLSYAIYYTHNKGMRMANLILVGYAMIMIGYSSYGLIYIRSQANPPIDQNSPDTIDDFVSFLQREQYGDVPLLRGPTYDDATGNINREESSIFPRRHSSQPNHLQKYGEYNSDWSFFWNYQVGHMYARYFNWNFIGRDSDEQDADWISGFSSSLNSDNPAHNRFFYVPFLLGLIGMVFHFSKDWKRALSVLTLFVVTGLAIVVYLNQTPFQPRERDYSFTGSFFAFSIWIGLGITGLIELIKQYLNSNKFIGYVILGLCLLGGPVLVGSQTYSNNDRSLRYVAPDYAYNLLNSVAPYGIIFTNGDNDTFPLWYLQEVEGVRRDVRVVNLSLLNTRWYIKQMKNQWNHEAPPVPMSFTDAEVRQMDSPSLFDPQEFRVPVNKEMLYQRKHAFDHSLPEQSPQSVLEQGDDFEAGELVDNDPLRDAEFADLEFTEEMGFGVPLDELDDEMRWQFEGTPIGDGRSMIRVQDEVALDIIQTNQWVRPIYFAITVAGDGQLNLNNYFRLEGKAFRVVPQRHDETYGAVDTDIHGERLKSFKFRETDNERAYFDENKRRMLDNYRTLFNQQADAFANVDQPDSSAYWLAWGEDRIPFSSVQGSLGSMMNYSNRYMELDQLERALNVAELARPRIETRLKYKADELNEVERYLNRTRAELDDGPSTSRRQRLDQRVERLEQERQETFRDMSRSISYMLVVQRAYFENDDEEKALELADFIDTLIGEEYGFPRDKDENLEQVNRLF